MKLRINNNSIRLRLSQTEVNDIGQGKAVYEDLKIGPSNTSAFRYSLIPDEEIQEVHAAFYDGNLEVTIPSKQGEKWAMSEEDVSIRSVQYEDTEGENLVLIEKDFQCLHKRPDEDESDSFPNPKSLDDYAKEKDTE
ncbi:hypothetical protein GCM10007049_22620 [Echinicola pacifica]|uniref:Uncharacterized protein n=1 Tax=Echinicola pacifica TaxID=346377 RepID=A0A918Q088_9BACT|nr:hypothetical protein [Echinicola pacifica]GGZ28991.1 hypothetical protein GCM10007049_22620 [Echinicola pacifica]